MTRYLILDAQGTILETVHGLADAGRAILTVDSDEYRVRRITGAEGGEGDWVLQSRNQTANRPWSDTRFWAYTDTAEAAEEAMLQQVANEASTADGWKAEAEEADAYEADQAMRRIEELILILGADALNALACEKYNAEDADARYDGDVWLGGGQGRWLDTAGLNEFADWVEAQQDNSWRET